MGLKVGVSTVFKRYTYNSATLLASKKAPSSISVILLLDKSIFFKYLNFLNNPKLSIFSMLLNDKSLKQNPHEHNIISSNISTHSSDAYNGMLSGIVWRSCPEQSTDDPSHLHCGGHSASGVHSPANGFKKPSLPVKMQCYTGVYFMCKCHGGYIVALD